MPMSLPLLPSPSSELPALKKAAGRRNGIGGFHSCLCDFVVYPKLTCQLAPVGGLVTGSAPPTATLDSSVLLHPCRVAYLSRRNWYATASGTLCCTYVHVPFARQSCAAGTCVSFQCLWTPCLSATGHAYSFTIPVTTGHCFAHLPVRISLYACRASSVEPRQVGYLPSANQRISPNVACCPSVSRGDQYRHILTILVMYREMVDLD